MHELMITNSKKTPVPVLENFDELKTDIEALAEQYKNSIYNDDQIKHAKADKAALNKLKTALNDARIRTEREYMEPFENGIKSQLNALIAIIDEPVKLIGEQVSAYDERRRQEKQQSIEELFAGKNLPAWLDFALIYNPKWLNASFSMKKIEAELDEVEAKIRRDLLTLGSLPEYAEEAKDVYKRTLDVNAALAEGLHLAEVARKRAEAEERRKAEEEAAERARAAEAEIIAAEAARAAEMAQYMNPPEEAPAPAPAFQWVTFEAYLTKDTAKELKKFFVDNGIEWKVLK